MLSSPVHPYPVRTNHIEVGADQVVLSGICVVRDLHDRPGSGNKGAPNQQRHGHTMVTSNVPIAFNGLR